MKFHHLGIACENHDEIIQFLRLNFGDIVVSEAIFDPLQDATVQMISLPDGTNVELISGERVAPFVRRNTLLYHTCWAVDNIEDSISTLVSSGAILISEAKEAILFDNRKVAFLVSVIGLIELVETSKGSLKGTLNL